MRLLFTFATFLGSFALFLLEPMVAKALLPSYGGSSLVWNGSLLFFQAILLAGYAYANLISRRLEPSRGRLVHYGVVGVALIAVGLVFVPGQLWHLRPPLSLNPLIPLLLTLFATTALPFFALSAGTPLIQRWFAQSDDPRAANPYFLYAASNLGSLLGLLAYPTLVEPRLTLVEQRELVLGLLALYAVVLVGMTLRLRPQASSGGEPAPGGPVVAANGGVSRGLKWRWAGLAAAPSALLLAATTELTKNIAPIPLLWVLPLALYLITFIIVFAGRGINRAAPGQPAAVKMALAIALLPMAFGLRGMTVPVTLAILFLLVSFFACALACHLELARQRPEAEHLTTYYLWISIGGVLGGTFCAILAPLIFNSLAELPLAYFACLFLYAAFQKQRQGKSSANGGELAKPQLMWLDFVWPTVAFVALWVLSSHSDPTWPVYVVGLAFVGSALWPVRFSLTFGAFLLVWYFGSDRAHLDLLLAARNAYGYEAVANTNGGAYHRLLNGNIMHGIQATDAVRRHDPLSYYSRKGPLGEALQQVLKSQPHAAIAAVGLGSGTIAAYGEPGVKIDFFELNPEIEKIARDPHLFTFLSDSKAQVQVILGDARLSLEHAPDNTYDALVLDAFSSDSIPVHLLTEEAMRLYRRKLKPGGLLLVHTSNRYLELDPVVATTGNAAGFVADTAADSGDHTEAHAATTWVALAQTRERLSEIEGKGRFWLPFKPEAGSHPLVWTDDYSNVFAVLNIFGRR